MGIGRAFLSGRSSHTAKILTFWDALLFYYQEFIRMGIYIAETILTGFLVGGLFHVTVWVMTRGIVWLGEFIESKEK